MTKECLYCHQSLSTPEFSRDSSRSDGLSIYCRTCKAAKKRKYKLKSGRTPAAALRLKNAGYEHLLVDTDIVPGVLEALWLLYGECGMCAKLGKHITTALQHDHVRPIQKRGTHTIDNIGFLCVKHNTSKQDRIMKDYRTIIWLDVILYTPAARQ